MWRRQIIPAALVGSSPTTGQTYPQHVTTILNDAHNSCVNYYCDMWPSHAHILKLLTEQFGLNKKAPINWINQMQKAFDKMHLLMAADALAAYPNHNKRFDIYTDASDFQLGACMEGRLPTSLARQSLSKTTLQW